MNPHDTGSCPLCGKSNGCVLCVATAREGSCWCSGVHIPEELLDRVPKHLRNTACICRDCVLSHHRLKADNIAAYPLLTGDSYSDSGFLVFTAQYLLRRGYCCGSGCRHCPYQCKAV